MCIDSMLWVKTVRIIRVERWEDFLKYLWIGLEYSDQTMQSDRHYGGTGAGSQEFMTFRIGAAWERGKVFVWLISL